MNVHRISAWAFRRTHLAMTRDTTDTTVWTFSTASPQHTVDKTFFEFLFLTLNLWKYFCSIGWMRNVYFNPQMQLVAALRELPNHARHVIKADATLRLVTKNVLVQNIELQNLKTRYLFFVTHFDETLKGQYWKLLPVVGWWGAGLAAAWGVRWRRAWTLRRANAKVVLNNWKTIQKRTLFDQNTKF